jgi:phosphoglucosamine mutase
MINVRIGTPVDLQANPALNDAVSGVESRLGDGGRVLLRPSGTEPVVRVMVEGRDATEVKTLCGELADQVAGLIGA